MADDTALATRRRTAGIAATLFRTARPRQTVKNVLVFAAPAAAGALVHRRMLLHASLAFASFCLAAAGTYFWNDLRDVEADRLHPRKRNRPIAAGLVSAQLARVVCLMLFTASFGVAALTGNVRSIEVVLGYIALTTSYSIWLKHIPVVDIGAVAGGFVIRAAAGSIATGVPMSRWFMIVASFGALFVVTGKRYGEYLELREGSALHRPALGEYPAAFLVQIRSIAAAVTIGAYCLWAFDRADMAGVPVFFQLSIAPFVLALLRYGLLVEAGHGGAPEDIVFGDRSLQLMGLAWAATLAIGIYVTP